MPPDAITPAYAVIKARQAFLFGARHLAPGDVVIDLRARGGAVDLATFRSLLRWSAFVVEEVAGPAPAPTPAEPPADDLQALAARTIAELNAEIARLTANLAVYAGPVTVERGIADPIEAIATATAAQLITLPGIGEAKAAALIAAAQELVAARPPLAPSV